MPDLTRQQAVMYWLYSLDDADLDALITAVQAGKNVSDSAAAEPAPPGGGGGLNSIWIPGSAFAGNASGFGSPGGAGEMAAFTFGAGQNTFGIASVIIPGDWAEFDVKYYVVGNDSFDDRHFVFESNYQLVDIDAVLDGDTNPFTVDFLNNGIVGSLNFALAATIENPGGATLFQLKIRSNNATQGVTGAIHLIGVLLEKVEA